MSCPSSATTAPPAGATTYAYDLNGNLTAKTDANNSTVNYGYDELNRLITKTASDGGNTAFSYSYDQGTYGKGRLATAANTNGIAGTSFTYDKMGRIATTQWLDYVDGVWGAGMQAQYDYLGHITQLTYPNGAVLSQVWDSAGKAEEYYRCHA